jgi:hypothetical protein
MPGRRRWENRTEKIVNQTGGKRMTYTKMLLIAVIAQCSGVTLALIGWAGVVIGSGLWRRLVVKIGTLIPFSIAYGIFVIGLLVFLCNYENEVACKKTYIWFVPLCLGGDALLLPIMVYFSGGVKQSLFSPLFFVIPAMAVVFVPWNVVSDIVLITGMTLLGYLIVYWLPAVIDPLPGYCYRIAECIVLSGSVILAVTISRKVSPLLDDVGWLGLLGLLRRFFV